jgi:predicted metal-dependent peptidase
MSVEEELKSIRGALLAVAPFFGSLLLKCSFRLGKDLRYPAANDGRKTILINPDEFMAMETRDRVFTLAHEAGHLAFLTFQRLGGRNPRLWNVATDCVINYILLMSNISASEKLVKSIITPKLLEKLTGVDKEKIAKMSADQIYNLLVALQIKGTKGDGDEHGKSVPTPGGCSHDEYATKDGEKDGAGGGDEEITEYWRRAVAEAHDFAKSIGKLPVGAEIILEILKPKVNWRALLRQAILQGPGLQVITTWKRMHRKIPNDLPGYTRLVVPNIWTLVDTSGSMVGENLNQVMTEVFEIAKSLNSKVRLIAWDTNAYEDTLEHVKLTLQVKGGGGTVITPALRLLLKNMKRNDIIVILTDGLIGDIDEPETQRMLEEAASKSASAVFASTVELPELPSRWRKVLIT